MILCGCYEIESIKIHPNDAPHTSHYVYVTKDKDEPKFSVTTCCDDEWSWEFWYSKTNYDIVKHLVMDCVFDAETMDELIDAMDEVFEEFCWEIVFDKAELQEAEFECDGDCENCRFDDDKYLN